MTLHPLPDGRFWYDVPPSEAVDLTLTKEQAPINEAGAPCSWPWDPQQLTNAPIGQYHCPYCGGMQLAGVRHLDWRDAPMRPAAAERSEANGRSPSQSLPEKDPG